MPAYSSLSIHIPAKMKQKFCGEPPVAIANAGLFLNHAIFLGEILDIYTAEALETINEVHNLPESLSRFFIEEDYEVMISFLDQLLTGINSAVGLDGNPLTSPTATKLQNSSQIRQAEDGSLVILSHNVHISDLRESLNLIRNMFVFAREYQLLVKME